MALICPATPRNNVYTCRFVYIDFLVIYDIGGALGPEEVVGDLGVIFKIMPWKLLKFL